MGAAHAVLYIGPPVVKRGSEADFMSHSRPLKLHSGCRPGYIHQSPHACIFSLYFKESSVPILYTRVPMVLYPDLKGSQPE